MSGANLVFEAEGDSAGSIPNELGESLRIFVASSWRNELQNSDALEAAQHVLAVIVDVVNVFCVERNGLPRYGELTAICCLCT
jgi:hypothetical protein